MKKKYIPFVLFYMFLFAGGAVFSQNSVLGEIDGDVRSAILIDYLSGDVLYEKNADDIIPPASLTKLISLYVTYEAIYNGSIDKYQQLTVPAVAAAYNQPPRSSLMFLEEGHRVNIMELMLGLSVSSGNDAAVCIAHNVAGSVPAFVDLMNRTVRRKGFDLLYFEDPAGLDPDNRVTAREYAAFARHYILTFPESLEEILSVQSFAYPKSHNLVSGRSRYGEITQKNRNVLLGQYEGLDGLKTGYIDESGYNIALTAQRGFTRFIVVVLGVEAPNHSVGTWKRAEAGKRILEYGFENYETVSPYPPMLEDIPVRGGEKVTVKLAAPRRPYFTLAKNMKNRVTYQVLTRKNVRAPIAEGMELGQLQYLVNGNIVAVTPVIAAETINAGNIFQVMLDNIGLFFENLFGGS